MEKKQSSIDYFFEEVVKWQMKPWLYASDGLEPIIKQAKAMHKEEIIEAYIEGHSIYGENTNSEQYYNETFGGNDENSIEEKLYTKDEVLDLLVNMNSWPTTFEGREDITEWFEQGQYY